MKFYRIVPTLTISVCHLSDERLPWAQLDVPCNELFLMQLWIEECTVNHPDCVVDPGRFAPTRLLDLSAFDHSNDLRLVSSQHRPSHTAEYVTLSHCWGSKPSRTATTTTKNIENNMERIPFARLPLTLRDAIRATRGLSVRYLWIDSLCIIQDSREDWEQEVTQMGQVYAASLCTLSAAMSENSDSGCRTATSKLPKTENNLPVDLKKGSKRLRFFKRSPQDWNKAWSKGPLCKRAWTLQERHLSTRNLFFSEDILLWECRTARASSELPWMQMKIEDPPNIMILNQASDTDIETHLLDLREYWFNVIEDYSGRGLTNPSDKLPALSGLVQKLNRGQYYAGLFEVDMPSALLWRSGKSFYSEETDITRPERYRAPTWSWASVEGPVTYESLWLYSGARAESLKKPDYGRFEIYYVTVNAVGDHDTGAVCTGFLRMRGRLAAAIVELGPAKDFSDIQNGWCPPEERTAHDNWTAVLNTLGERIGALYPDDVAEVKQGQRIYCLEVRREVYGSKVSMPDHIYGQYFRTHSEDTPMPYIGLALTQDDEDAGIYRRLGLVRWVKESMFSGLEPCEISIY